MGDNVRMDVSGPEPPAPGSVVRLAVRVLLVDQEDRVLLFRYSADDGEPRISGRGDTFPSS